MDFAIYNNENRNSIRNIKDKGYVFRKVHKVQEEKLFHNT